MIGLEARHVDLVQRPPTIQIAQTMLTERSRRVGRSAGDCVRHHDLTAVADTHDAGGFVQCRPVEVLIALLRFPHVDADTNCKATIDGPRVRADELLELDRRVDRRVGCREDHAEGIAGGRKDSTTGVSEHRSTEVVVHREIQAHPVGLLCPQRG